MNVGRVIEASKLLNAPGFLMAVGLRQVPGWEAVNIVGEKLENLSTTLQDDISNIDGTTLLTQPRGADLELVSSNAADISSAETGVKEVDIHYLDDNFVRQEVRKSMNGTTPVDLSGISYQDILWLHAVTIGTSAPNQTAVGNIDVRGAGAGDIYARVTAGGNQSTSSLFRVPADHIGMIRSWNASGLKQETSFKLRATCEKASRVLIPGVFLFQAALSLDGTGLHDTFDAPLFFPPLCEVKVSAIGRAAGAKGSANYTIFIVHKDAIGA